MIVPVILCGGSGTRLWPMSRELYPKQLLPLLGERSMLQDTLSRLEGIEGQTAPLFVCNEEHRFMVAEQVRQWKRHPEAIILEPQGRNTAPATAVSALYAADTVEDPVLLVLPADHVIRDPQAFRDAVRRGLNDAREGRLVTFGIVPDHPETGYGYIRTDGDVREMGATDAGGMPVLEFVEKPDRETAEEYVRSGRYLWNSGMFMFTAGSFLEELREHAPEILDGCRGAYEGGNTDMDFFRLGGEAFLACPSNSIDYAVMERTDRATVVPLEAGWSDVGSWSALWQVQDRDDSGNVCRGDVLCNDVANSYLHSTDRLIAGVGLRDLVVVETKDAVLVADKDRGQEVKEIVKSLERQDRQETTVHRRVFRPWGSYETIDAGQRFQVKRIVVNPGSVLSLQMHHHRAEHWVVVRGTAKITQGERECILSEDQSTYIPLGTPHRLENPGKIPLELIEVQTGSYLGEDDIVRFQDMYGR
jgi:mannose-1-phosphate guanylyltransferase/mannose-6-phosphate isomerase